MAEWNPPHYNPPSLNIEGITIEGVKVEPISVVEPLKPSQNIVSVPDLPFMCCEVGTIPTSYKEALSYEQQILWICNYLETVVIPALNQNANAVTELKNLFNQLMAYYITLQNYVNNTNNQLVNYINTTNKTLVDYINNSLTSIVDFINNTNEQMSDFINNTIDEMKEYIDDCFTDLNVQDEINNKLDQMVADGTMDLIINKNVLPQKLSRFIIKPTMTIEQIQAILDYDYSKILEFEDGNYTFNSQLSINSNTTILLNNATINSNIVFTFTNFKNTDEFLEYNGHSNISIIGGKFIGGGICFAHTKNITIKDITFEKCSGDHFIQIAAGNSINIINCTFDGIPSSAEYYREYVQIDNMDYTSFPLFSENNPTYDNTPNKNWLVENCVFSNDISKSDSNYTMRVGIGNHSSNIQDDILHSNISVKNCVFKDTTTYSIRAISINNFTIQNCDFTTDTIANEYKGSHIECWHRISNMVIDNNNFQNNYRSINFHTPVYIDNVEITNNVFQNYTIDDNNAVIVRCFAIGNLLIANNNFLNNTQTHIHIDGYSLNTNLNPNHNYKIDNNLFYSENQTKDIIKIYNGYPSITSNVFNIPDNSTNIAFQYADRVGNPFVKDNILNPTKMYTPDNLPAKYIYDKPFILFQGEILSSSNVYIPKFAFKDFSRLILICGYEDNAQTINLSPYPPNGFSTSTNGELYSFIVGNNNPVKDNTPTMVSLAIDSEGHFRYNIGTTNYPIRKIIGIN